MFGQSWTLRYTWHKIWQSVEAGRSAAYELQTKMGSAGREGQETQEMYVKIKEAVQKRVAESFSAPLTQVIKFTGPAMAPTLNSRSKKDSAAHEFLLAHRIVAPTATNVLKGDVVAFRPPLPAAAPQALMVRRVSAQGGEMLESEADSASHELAPDTVWVTADNAELEPPHVEDSRTFGPVQLDAIVGRCIYAVRSKADRGVVVNNPRWRGLDGDVISAELTDDVLDELASDASA